MTENSYIAPCSDLADFVKNAPVWEIVNSI